MPQGDTSCTGTHMPALPARGSNIYAAGGIQSKLWVYNHVQGFPGSSDGNESACNAGDLGLIPVSGRSPGGGNGSPLQYSCLENPQLEKNHVAPPSSQDEALGRYSVSREVPRSILKYKTVLGTLDATPKVP